MFKKSKYIALICGVTSMAVTVAFYLLIFGSISDVPIIKLSLAALLLAELIGTIKAFLVKRTIFAVANILTSVFHIIAVLILSIIFVNFFETHITLYILLNVFGVSALLICDVVIVYFANQSEGQQRKLKERQSVVLQCVEKSSSLYVLFGNSEYGKELEQIVEALNYSDNSSLTGDEIAIMNKLDELELLLINNDSGIAQKITEIKNAIKLRSIKVAGTKRGKY